MTTVASSYPALPPLDGNLIPNFELPRAGGGSVRVRAYRGRRSLALYFLHQADCAPCREIIAGIVPHYGDYALADAEPLVILPDGPEAVDALRREVSAPFPLLSDAEGTAGTRYGVAADGAARTAALLITDRFGVPALWQPAGAGHVLPDQSAVLRELEYLSHTCSAGCATPIWPAP